MQKQSVPSAAAKAAVPEGLSGGLRRYLYLTATVTGMVIMIVEILGAKMLAPYVGTSHFVWTSQIAVTLVALSAGYYAGGWLVDRKPNLGRMYGAILVAGIYLCGTVLVVKPVAFWCLNAAHSLAVGSLMASAILFFVPLALLAMTGPFFVRILASSVRNVGGTVGRLTAVGTLGSFAGTLLIGYLLLPLLPNSVTMFASASALLLVAGGYFAIWNRKGPAVTGLAVGLLAGASMGFAGVDYDRQPLLPGDQTRFRGNSNFGELIVVDREEPSGMRRLYLNDLLTQNLYDTNTHQSTAMFTYMLHDLAVDYTAKIDDVLCIGLGVGIAPARFVREEKARVDVVEINRAVVPVAREFFDCPTEQMHITIGDGRQFLNECRKKYDAVVLDAFLGDSSPSHLMTQEAFRAVQAVLKPDGVLVINTFGYLEPKKDFFTASLYKTLRSVFKTVRIHTTEAGGNIITVATDAAVLKFAHQPNFEGVHPDCRSRVEAAFAGTPEPNPDSGFVLTDNYNPVEYYDAANREKFRRDMTWDLRAARQ